jgi:hypothetical protein
MEKNLLNQINLLSRYALAFVFIYHGLVPKILWLSPIESQLTNAHGLEASVISPLAGVLEILLGLSIILIRKSLMPIYVAMLLLAGLLLDVIIIMPNLLIEAFNPVTINIVSMVVGYIICLTHQSVKKTTKH